MFNGKIHYKLLFSIATLDYQRVFQAEQYWSLGIISNIPSVEPKNHLSHRQVKNRRKVSQQLNTEATQSNIKRAQGSEIFENRHNHFFKGHQGCHHCTLLYFLRAYEPPF